jgi:hypothetical protein
MKKVFVLSVFLFVCMLIGFACKKSNSTTNNTNSTSSTSGVPTNTTTTNFTVDATPASNPTVSVNNSSGNYAVTGIDGSHIYPQILLVFPGTSSPVSGGYAIVNTHGASPAAGQCELILTTTSGSYPASSGNVTVAAGTSSSAYFTNITCTNSNSSPTTHTVTGNVKWP